MRRYKAIAYTETGDTEVLLRSDSAGECVRVAREAATRKGVLTAQVYDRVDEEVYANLVLENGFVYASDEDGRDLMLW